MSYRSAEKHVAVVAATAAGCFSSCDARWTVVVADVAEVLAWWMRVDENGAQGES